MPPCGKFYLARTMRIPSPPPKKRYIWEICRPNEMIDSHQHALAPSASRVRALFSLCFFTAIRVDNAHSFFAPKSEKTDRNRLGTRKEKIRAKENGGIFFFGGGRGKSVCGGGRERRKTAKIKMGGAKQYCKGKYSGANISSGKIFLKTYQWRRTNR